MYFGSTKAKIGIFMSICDQFLYFQHLLLPQALRRKFHWQGITFQNLGFSNAINRRECLGKSSRLRVWTVFHDNYSTRPNPTQTHNQNFLGTALPAWSLHHSWISPVTGRYNYLQTYFLKMGDIYRLEDCDYDFGVQRSVLKVIYGCNTTFGT